jgi:hypothetical protein
VDVTELLDVWAQKYDVKSVLERAGDASPACSALVRRGAVIRALVDDERSAGAMRAAYGGAVNIASPRDDDEKHDMVVIHGHVDPSEIPLLAKRATKLVVVVAPNPRAIQARVPGAAADTSWGATESLAGVLWQIGRVREHLWIDAPAFARAMPRVQRALARRHVFVVDVTPRSPQARRKVRLQAT